MSITVGNIVVDTNNPDIATRVASRAEYKKTVRGVIQVMGERYHWSDLQQYQQHGGFTTRRVQEKK